MQPVRMEEYVYLRSPFLPWFSHFFVGMVTMNTLNLKSLSSIMYMVPKSVHSNNHDRSLRIHKQIDIWHLWHISPLSYLQTVHMRMFPNTFFCFRHPFCFGWMEAKSLEIWRSLCNVVKNRSTLHNVIVPKM
jgi:hypothetical protein